MTTALIALMCDVLLEVARALIKKRLGRKQLPEPVEPKEVSE